MTTRTATIVNALGMHARAAAKFVHLASRFDTAVRVSRNGREVDGKSILGLLLLAAPRCSSIAIAVEGEEEAAVMAALLALVESGFGEGPCSD